MNCSLAPLNQRGGKVMATRAQLKTVETVENVIDKMDAERANNLRLWNVLSKTDPQATKGFKRAGGEAEFHPPKKLPEDLGRGEDEMSSSALRASLRLLVHHINGAGSVADLEEILETEDAKEVIDNCQRRFPAWWETGEAMPAEFVPLKKLIDQTRAGLKQLETQE
jgi:hypothetical protein